MYFLIFYQNYFIGLRNFDLVVKLKDSANLDAKEYSFASIDRAEYSALYDFLMARNLNIIKNQPQSAKTLDLGQDDEDEDEEEDDDYVGGNSDDDDDDDDSGSDEEGDDEDNGNDVPRKVSLI